MNEQSDRSESDRKKAEIDARLTMIETRLAYSLPDEQIAEVRKRIEQSIALGAVLRAYPLTNADEPEIGFVPYRGTR